VSINGDIFRKRTTRRPAFEEAILRQLERIADALDRDEGRRNQDRFLESKWREENEERYKAVRYAGDFR